MLNLILVIVWLATAAVGLYYSKKNYLRAKKVQSFLDKVVTPEMVRTRLEYLARRLEHECVTQIKMQQDQEFGDFEEFDVAYEHRRARIKYFQQLFWGAAESAAEMFSGLSLEKSHKDYLPGRKLERSYCHSCFAHLSDNPAGSEKLEARVGGALHCNNCSKQLGRLCVECRTRAEEHQRDRMCEECNVPVALRSPNLKRSPASSAA